MNVKFILKCAGIIFAVNTVWVMALLFGGAYLVEIGNTWLKQPVETALYIALWVKAASIFTIALTLSIFHESIKEN